MEKSEHLQYFKVENFKGFDSLEMTNIGQFNLIAGDNNIGKTSLLEALLFSEDLAKLNSYYFHAFTERNSLPNKLNEFDFMSYYQNKQKKSNQINYTTQINSIRKNNYTLRTSTIDKLDANQLEKIKTKLMLNKHNFRYVTILDKNGENIAIELMFDSVTALSYSPMVFYSIGYRDDLIQFYSDKIQKSKEIKSNFLAAVRLFIPTIEDIEIVPSEINNYSMMSIRLDNVDGLIPLSMFGEGANKLFRILLEIQMANGGRLMVDEIDTGIHFSRFKVFWKIIMQSAAENNVQLFATTHNLECLKYFKEALEDKEMIRYQKDAKHFLIEHVVNNEIKAFNYNFEQFESAIDLGNEIRGGE